MKTENVRIFEADEDSAPYIFIAQSQKNFCKGYQTVKDLVFAI